MKLLIAAILAFAISAEAGYAPPVVPAVTYGVPEESRPVVPATVYGVPEEYKPVVAPIKTEYSYTIPAHEEHLAPYAPVQPVVPAVVYGVPEDHHEEYVVAAPVAPAAPSVTIQGPSSYTTLVQPHEDLHEEYVVPAPVAPVAPSVTIQGPSTYTTLVQPHEEHHEYVPAVVAPVAPVAPSVTIQGPTSYTTLVQPAQPHVYSVPTLYHAGYTSGYSGLPIAAPIHTSYIRPSLGYSSLSHGYIAPHVAYEAPAAPSVNIVGPQVSYVQPSAVTAVVSGSDYDGGEHGYDHHEDYYNEDDHHEDYHHEEVYEVAHQEPVVTKYDYSIPQVVVPEKVVVQEVPRPVVPHTAYGLPY